MTKLTILNKQEQARLLLHMYEESLTDDNNFTSYDLLTEIKECERHILNLREKFYKLCDSETELDTTFRDLIDKPA